MEIMKTDKELRLERCSHRDRAPGAPGAPGVADIARMVEWKRL